MNQKLLGVMALSSIGFYALTKGKKKNLDSPMGADAALVGPAGMAFVKAVKAGELTLQEIKDDKTGTTSRAYNRTQVVWSNLGAGVHPDTWLTNKNKLTKAYYKFTGKRPYSWSGMSYTTAHGGIWYVSAYPKATFTIAADWESGKRDAIIYLEEELREKLQRLETDKKLAELKTANELMIQQANIERAKWQSEKEKLENAILSAKLREAERKEQDSALQQAKLHAEAEKKSKQKKVVRNLAIVGTAIAAMQMAG